MRELRNLITHLREKVGERWLACLMLGYDPGDDPEALMHAVEQAMR
jgi:hypothetical protein